MRNPLQSEIGANAGDTWDTRDLVNDEIFEVIDVGNHDTQKVVAVSRHQITLHDLVEAIDRAGEARQE